MRKTGYEWLHRFSQPRRYRDRYTDRVFSSDLTDWNRDTNCAEFLSMEKQVSILALAARASCCRNSAELRSLSSASASVRGLFGGTSRPSTSERITSGMPETGVDTTGTPLAIASSNTLGMPSRSPSAATTQGSAKTQTLW